MTNAVKKKYYDDEFRHLIAYMYLFTPEMSVREMAEYFGIKSDNGTPNQSSARQIIQRYLEGLDKRAYNLVDSEEAFRNKESPSREQLSTRRNRFFPDPEERGELGTQAQIIYHDHLSIQKSRKFKELHVVNDKMDTIREKLEARPKDEIDEAVARVQKIKQSPKKK